MALVEIPTWLADLLTPVHEKLEVERERHAAALQVMEASSLAMTRLEAQFQGLVLASASSGLSEEAVTAACVARLERARPPLGRVASLAELMAACVQIIGEAPRPVTVDEVMAGLATLGIAPQGKDPRANLLAYISRSDAIRSVRRGLYALTEL